MGKSLMDKLILREMVGGKTAKRLIREFAGEDPMGNDPMGGMGGNDPMGGAGADPMGGAGSDPMGGGADPMAGGMGGNDPMGGAGADPMGGGTDPMAGGMGGTDPMGGAGADPMAGGMGAGNDPMGGSDPMGGIGGPADPMGGDDPIGGDPMGGDSEDDAETLNIDNLTDAQERMNDKINTIGRNQIKSDEKFEELINSIHKMQSIIDNNNKEIQRLQQDVIKRNPTPTENLQLQSLASYPYNTNISDYWADYIKTGRNNYNVIAGGMSSKADAGQDIDGSNEDFEYEITTDDLDDLSDDELYKTFSVYDDGASEHNLFKAK